MHVYQMWQKEILICKLFATQFKVFVVFLFIWLMIIAHHAFQLVILSFHKSVHLLMYTQTTFKFKSTQTCLTLKLFDCFVGENMFNKLSFVYNLKSADVFTFVRKIYGNATSIEHIKRYFFLMLCSIVS